MKKNYKEPSLNIIFGTIEDVLTASNEDMQSDFIWTGLGGES